MNRIDSWPNDSGHIRIAGEECFCETIKTILPLFCPATSASSSVSNIGITTALSWDRPLFLENLIRLLNMGCDNILILWSGSDDTWAMSGICFLHDDLVQKIQVDFPQLTQKITSLKPHGADVNWKRHRLLQLLQSRLLYSLLSRFGHNAKADITNRFLAPVRMLLHARKVPEVKIVWESVCTTTESIPGIFAMFQGEVCNQIQKDKDELYGQLGKMICGYAQELIDCLNVLEFDEYSRQNAIKWLDQMMSLLTECRQMAGIKIRTNIRDTSDNRDNVASDITKYAGRSTGRRVLIIDDDAKSWLSVLKQIKTKIEIKFDSEIEICVSEDANTYQTIDVSTDVLTESHGSVERGLPDFDLLLLDVYLGNEYGLDILKRIRSRIMHLPVILWTTSSDKELPSQAALANGFIFKKTATINSIADLISSWLSIGRSQRLWSLPNPFFDHALRDPNLREVALAFTKWTLRYMDCFHAIDHFYFRYFNDHGGRHILGVLDTAAKLLRPFLFENSLLSKDADTRNKQLFCLYIAILCHEFGMFPIYKGETPLSNKQPDNTKYWKQMESMRKLHGIRGMLMLMSDFDNSSSQFNVEGLGNYLGYLNNIDAKEVVRNDCRAVIALLVGYHQRCLDLSATELNCYADETIFEEKNGGKDDKSAKSKIEKAETATTKGKNWTDWIAVKKSITSTWRQAVDFSGSIWDINSIRRLCAILRFADALDVDHTRVPADFILNDTARRAMQDVEDCKRQVLSSVEIDQGIISLQFFAGEHPEWLTKCLAFASTYIHEIKKETLNAKDREDFLLLTRNTKAEDKPVFKALLDHAELYGGEANVLELINNPWDENEHIENIDKLLKGCLQVYFLCLKSELSIFPSEEVEASMSKAAALLVVIEIKSEYEAIKKVELDDHIRLDKNLGWSGKPHPSILKDRK